MKKVGLDVWIQLIGMLSIVASLIFVGLEMRQTQQIALSTQQQERAHKAVDMILGFMEAGHDFDAIMRAETSEGLNEFQQMGRRNFYQTTLYFAENDFNQYENGLLSQTDYEIKVVNVLEFLLSQCEMRPILDFRIRFFSKELLKVAGSIEDPCD